MFFWTWSQIPSFAEWSISQLEAASLTGSLLINDVIYAELSLRCEAKEQLDAFVDGMGLKIEPIPTAALFLAGKVFQKYRQSGGARTGVLPDSFIDVHAAVSEYPLLTRDIGRYRNYYPTLELITP